MSWGTASPITISGRVQTGANRLTGRVSCLLPLLASSCFLSSLLFPQLLENSCTAPSLATGSPQGALQSRAEVLKQKAESD